MKGIFRGLYGVGIAGEVVGITNSDPMLIIFASLLVGVCGSLGWRD